MENLFIILLANVIIICLLLYCKIYIKLKYQRDGSNDYIAIDVYSYGKLLAYSMQVPMIEMTDIKNSLWLKSKIKVGHSQDETNIKREQRFIKKTLDYYILHPKRLKGVIRLVRYYTRLYCRVMNKYIKSMHCERIQWNTLYGSEDAEQTGIVTGMLWTVKGLLITRLKKRVIVTNAPIINVNFLFGHNSFKVDFDCIFSIRLGNVINAMRILYNTKR